MLLPLPLEKRAEHPPMVRQDLVQVPEDLADEAPEPLGRGDDGRVCGPEGLDEDLVDELEVAGVVSLALEYLEEDGLALDFRLAEGVAGAFWDEAVPLLVLFWEEALLEAAEAFLGVQPVGLRLIKVGFHILGFEMTYERLESSLEKWLKLSTSSSAG